MLETSDIEAELRFLTTEEGGRRTPVYSGYVGQFHFDLSDWDVGHYYPEASSASPGDTVRAELSFVSPHLIADRIHVGMEFECREGRKTIARGRITKILNLHENATNRRRAIAEYQSKTELGRRQRPWWQRLLDAFRG
jgi:translation elongation factor EF-Tu-like GTPase